jgi:hypothetical protein
MRFHPVVGIEALGTKPALSAIIPKKKEKKTTKREAVGVGSDFINFVMTSKLVFMRIVICNFQNNLQIPRVSAAERGLTRVPC